MGAPLRMDRDRRRFLVAIALELCDALVALIADFLGLARTAWASKLTRVHFPCLALVLASRFAGITGGIAVSCRQKGSKHANSENGRYSPSVQVLVPNGSEQNKCNNSPQKEEEGRPGHGHIHDVLKKNICCNTAFASYDI